MYREPDMSDHRGFPMTSVAPELGVAMWALVLWCHSLSLLWPPSHTHNEPQYRFVSSTQLCYRMVQNTQGILLVAATLEGDIWSLRKA